MSFFKCKMCGGTIEFNPGDSIGVCDSCGTKQTLPRLDEDRRANLYDRANHFRRNNEFDKAAGLYEQILNEDPSDAEAYWSLVLCRYGIEYVEEPATHKRVPTVNRTQFTSIFDDENYKSALKYAYGFQRTLYEEEAATINEIQKDILAISQKESPFDVFICYKETDTYGHRTQDSVLANDIYHHLTNEGFKVFFSRITLEDKLGKAYEPYIFAALNSAKVMLVLGTKPEYFNAAWVKNEWNRYLSLVNQSGGKKVLIPAYRDMDPYDLPEEFSHLQAQDMSKLGFMQDLIRGIKKITIGDESRVTVKETAVTGFGVSAAPLLKRAFMFLEDGEWNRADDFCEQVLNLEPENAQAYLGKLMVELRVRRQEDLCKCEQPFDKNRNFQKAIRFGDDKLAGTLAGYIDHINDVKYNAAVNLHNAGKYEEAIRAFQALNGYKDSAELITKCKIAIRDANYDAAIDLYNAGKYYEAIKAFRALNGYKDSAEMLTQCEESYNTTEYKTAVELYNAGKHGEALKMFWTLNGYKDSAELMKNCVKNIEVGDTIKLGRYKQHPCTNKLATDGEEAIEWIVLAKDGMTFLLISQYVLDFQQYNTYCTAVTWETCSLRQWLNGVFISNVFNSEEQRMIQSTVVTADRHPSYNTSPGINTTDKLFLLSINEAKKYFSSDSARQCQVRTSCYEQDAHGHNNENCSWWLRSPGINSLHAAGVCNDGSIDYNGNRICGDYDAVRPALWINLES